APRPRVIIAGAGHIAVPLAAVASICEFAVTVLDDRPQYATTQRFPSADQVLAGPFTAELRRLRGPGGVFDGNTHLVLVTRGHQHDIECLLEVLDDPLAYIGMIGSRRRIKACFQRFRDEEKVTEEAIERIYAPIGLDIATETPAEIAVSILGEVIKIRRGGKAASLSGH
ncbi:MAG: XdhC family protein, partial [Candidatus Binatia bacterium]